MQRYAWLEASPVSIASCCAMAAVCGPPSTLASQEVIGCPTLLWTAAGVRSVVVCLFGSRSGPLERLAESVTAQQAAQHGPVSG